MEKEGEVVGKRIQEMLSGIVLKIGTASATKVTAMAIMVVNMTVVSSRRTRMNMR